MTMRKILTFVASLFVVLLHAQKDKEEVVLDLTKQFDSIEKSLKYEHGIIELDNGIGKIKIPKGFKYLNAQQAEKVLVDVWGNPKSETPSLGMIMLENQGVTGMNGYVFNIEYDAIGYVKDDDADDIDYDELLTQMKEDSKAENEIRVKEGYEPITIVGWAAKPFYDKDRKILHWAKEIKFGKDEVNTLNYNIRILGRKGVLVLNAISTVKELPLVKKDISKVLNIVEFNDGYRYDQFDSNVDDVAAWTIGGLVAGKVLAKVGFFAAILKFWKVIAIAFLAFFGKIKNMIFGNKEQVVTRPVVVEEEKEEENKA